MPKIAELLRAKRTLSFEFSPPRDENAERQLYKTLLTLEKLAPDFTSVTYGALGSTKDKTREIVEHIHHDTSMPVMPHLTCVGHTRAQIAEIVGDYRDMGIENLLCLGGDPPVDGHPIADDFHYATELIEAARELGDFSIGVAAFPEMHPRSPDRETDRRHLAAKLRMADFGITQFGFVADHYLRMVDELAALGVDTPVIPSVMLFRNVEGCRRMSQLNRTTIPAALDAALDRVDGDATEVRKLAVEWGTELARTLLDAGVPGIHFYTLGASRATLDVYANLGLPGAMSSAPS
ncbi:MAG TPA: methylenetetrahydrofolate reductase [Acidimicrobiales bacterium]|nr:methylenetetrahydrofolate reductase [Acidimicrobiales bacterium]